MNTRDVIGQYGRKGANLIMKKIVVISSLVLCSVIIVLILILTKRTSINTFENKQFGIYFEYPKEWKLNKSSYSSDSLIISLCPDNKNTTIDILIKMPQDSEWIDLMLDNFKENDEVESEVNFGNYTARKIDRIMGDNHIISYGLNTTDKSVWLLQSTQGDQQNVRVIDDVLKSMEISNS
ncbi:hypothetical protein E5161_17075 [Cohnella pontilimi]|uniref:Uncharacterized protein n=1 Tax=Cohnella pontilimi TaxID=2564100 RepID=A0A4U0F8H9_9BACL|nr:hypothetical protein [Cohnella pontilimi]TJY40850.1 hypothetical protein E5161_17075 [Cohnella pontilimi]